MQKVKKALPWILLVLITVAFCFVPSAKKVIDAADSGSSVEQSLLQNVEKQVEKIDFSGLDQFVFNIANNSDFDLFNGSSFNKKIADIISGKFANDYPNVFSAILALFLSSIISFLPTLVLIVAIAIVFSLTSSLKSSSSGKGVGEIIHFVCYGAIITILLTNCAQLITLTSQTISNMKLQMDIIFPILLTLVTAVGGIVSVGVYQPAIVMLSQGIMQLFNYVLLPLFIVCLVFSVVGNLSQTTKLNNFNAFFSSCFKWIIGIVFTVFFAFLTIQGITAGIQDGISIKAAKLTIRSYVPIMGGYLSEGLDLILASSVLIKNAVGVAGMLLLFGTVLVPVLQVVAFVLGFKLVAAIIEPICDERIHKFITSVSKNFTMLIACMLGAAFMYFLTLGLLITTANII